MVEERRWSLTNKVTQLDGGFGQISTIKWKDNLIAWANSKVNTKFFICMIINFAAIIYINFMNILSRKFM